VRREKDRSGGSFVIRCSWPERPAFSWMTHGHVCLDFALGIVIVSGCVGLSATRGEGMK
jgi:hypothetical protein